MIVRENIQLQIILRSFAFSWPFHYMCIATPFSIYKRKASLCLGNIKASEQHRNLIESSDHKSIVILPAMADIQQSFHHQTQNASAAQPASSFPTPLPGRNRSYNGQRLRALNLQTQRAQSNANGATNHHKAEV
ncbi:hypothetical protein L6164_011984 [Bauhinia variegata]|uniref:Uncharacterized protein n=1 Tax=Bauhinia variegata TaxID=167791 RepID=A0ACB9PDS8_BAUVA|nr:hypothetical protein L6164_011984 [Bauhinia variegata]